MAEAFGLPGLQAGKVAPDASVPTHSEGVGLALGLEGSTVAAAVEGAGAWLELIDGGAEAAGVDMHPDRAMRTGTRVAATDDRTSQPRSPEAIRETSDR